MKCPYCNTDLQGKNICPSCGNDVKIFYKAESASNLFYNQGLKKAKVHDLSGAIVDLKKSLKLNKKNTQARNLLGLVYYEMGEVVNALSEWVVSKHFQEENNKLADMYLKDIQSSPAKIDNFNQSFKKFNLALESIKQNNEDLALIHLKKVINLNPHYIKAMQLLALVYIKQNENEKAKRMLNRAKKLDISNTTTLLYLAEVSVREENSSAESVGYDRVDTGRITPFNLSPLDSYREEKPNVMAFVNLIIGIIIGIGVVAFLIVPTVKSNAAEKYNVAVLENGNGASVSASESQTLKTTNESLQSQLTEKEKELKELNSKVVNMKVYDSLFAASKYFIEGNESSAADSISKVDVSKFGSEEAQVLYDYIKGEVYADTVQQYAKEGRELCNAGKMEEALEPLLKAYDLSHDNDVVLYFLGRSYQKLEKKADAKKYFDELIEKFPNSSRTSTAKRRLKEMGYQ